MAAPLAAAVGKVRDLATEAQHPWGRVDETGTVYVREADGERVVGQYPDGTADEALAYFERKFTDLAGQVGLLEQRARRGAPIADISKAVSTLREHIATANAVGDLASLTERLSRLGGEVEELSEHQSAEAKAAIAEAIIYRTAIVEEAESLAAEDPANTQWKQATATLDVLFARWQEHQRTGPRLPKAEAGELWKRFRAARATIEHNRKAFFADLDAQHRQVKDRKSALIDEAESLIGRGIEGIPTYRELLEQWKLAGRAGKRNDDALWARFKAAGDALYSAKSELDAKESEKYQGNLELKLELLAEAETLLNSTDRDQARNTLLSIQRRWDEIGRVPREQVKSVEERLRKVESAVRRLDEEHWARNNPEKRARSEGLASQLNAAIAKLEAELAEAKASGDQSRVTAAQEALDARRVWLDAIK